MKAPQNTIYGEKLINIQDTCFVMKPVPHKHSSTEVHIAVLNVCHFYKDTRKRVVTVLGTTEAPPLHT